MNSIRSMDLVCAWEMGAGSRQFASTRGFDLGQDGTGQMGQLVLRYVELVGTEIVYLYI